MAGEASQGVGLGERGERVRVESGPSRQILDIREARFDACRDDARARVLGESLDAIEAEATEPR